MSEWGWSNLRGTLASTDRSCTPTRVLSLNLQEGWRFPTGKIGRESERGGKWRQRSPRIKGRDLGGQDRKGELS